MCYTIGNGRGRAPTTPIGRHKMTYDKSGRRYTHKPWHGRFMRDPTLRRLVRDALDVGHIALTIAGWYTATMLLLYVCVTYW